MKKILAIVLTVVLMVSVCPLGLFTFTANAATSGYYTYTVSGNEATITSVNTSISGDITIPSTLGGYTVTSIGEGAFQSCSSLKSIIILDSVTSIGIGAFSYCGNLTSVSIGNSVTSIAEHMFDSCSSLVSVTIPNSVTFIGMAAFSSCTSLTSINIPDSVTSIGMGAFSSCTSLKSIIIPDSVTSIEMGAFSSCTSLTSINIPDSVTDIDFGAFSSCANLATIIIPDSPVKIRSDAFIGTACWNNSSNWENGVLYIGKHLVGTKSDISECTIKDGTLTIADSVFYGCKNLISVTIPGSVTSIRGDTFFDCSNLTSVTIGNGVTSIGNSAFRNCTNLTSITIPDSVTFIDNSAFESCTSLASITLPDSAVRMEASAFRDTAYYNNSSNWENRVLYIGKHLIETKTSISGNYTIKAGTLTIAGGAFYQRQYITSVTIPNSVISIGDSAFYSCTKLASFNVPDSVAFIDSNAFYNTAYYKDSSNWENGVLYIGKHLIEARTSISGNYTIKEGTLTIAGVAFLNCNKLTSVTIPNSVLSIGDFGFDYCKNLESITIPKSVTSIGEYAFYGCTSLKTVYYGGTNGQWEKIEIDGYNDCLLKAEIIYAGITITGTTGDCTWTLDGTVLTISGNGAMEDYGYWSDVAPWGTSITKVVIEDGVTNIGEYAFFDCSSLTSVNIPDSVTSICDGAFDSCSNLTSINIPNSVTSIGNYAFSECSSLTSINIPNGVMYIEMMTFEYCTNLISVTIPSSVILIDTAAFQGCTSLTSIVIPNGVRSIIQGAFSNCTNLDTIVLPNTIKYIDDWAFANCNSLKTVYYEGTKDQWNKIKICEIDEFSNEELLNANIIFAITWENITSSTVSIDKDGNIDNVIKVEGSSSDSKVYNSDTATIKPNTRYYITFEAKGVSKGNYLNFGVGNVSNTASIFFMGKENKSGICRLFINGVEKNITSDFTNVSTVWQSYGIVFDTGSAEFLAQNNLSSQNVLNNASYIFFGAKNSTVYLNNIKITEIGSNNAPLPDEDATPKHSIRNESNDGKYQSAGLRFRATISNEIKASANEIGFIIVPAKVVAGDDDWYDMKSGINSAAKIGTWYVKNEKDIVYSLGADSTDYQLILTGLSNQSGENIYDTRFVAVAYVKIGNYYTYYSLGEMSYSQIRAEYDIRGIE